MRSVYDGKKENCCGCGVCAAKCPKDALEMTPDDEGFLYPAVNGEKCVDCGLCVRVCPVKRNGNFKENAKTTFYSATHKSKDVLTRSTSGGAFTAVSDVVLASGGAVCGVVLDENLRAAHRLATEAKERDKMRFSKYVQSDMTGIYAKIKQALEERTVLFTGTPCQCAAVRSYFEASRLKERLFVCDLICHSVPSPLVWEEYKKLLERENGGALEEAFFRSKKHAWSRENSNKGFLYKIKGHSGYKEDDRFYNLFIYKGTIARPSCEKCPYTDTRRASDMTIADCFGIEKYAPELYDALGVSLIGVNSEKGREMLLEISKNMATAKRSYEEILPVQQRLSKPVEFPKERSYFWEKLRAEGFAAAIGENNGG